MGLYRALSIASILNRHGRSILAVLALLWLGFSTATRAIAQETAAAAPKAASAAESVSGNEDAAASAELAKSHSITFEPHIRDIFVAHCLECHGPKQSKADMRVDDRATLLSYIAPGDLESSSLWTDYLTTSDPEMHMPPLKHGNPLSALELAAIRVWIEDGAIWPEATRLSIADTSPAGETASSAPQPTANKNIVLKAMTFMGFFHPAIVHFPIGLLLVSCMFVILSFINRPAFEGAAFHCLWIGALGAVASCMAGWTFADIRGYGDFWNTTWNDDAIARHRICGIALSVLALVVTGIAFTARKRDTSGLRFVWLGGAIGLALMVGIVGHQGGELTYGEELFAKAFEQSFGK